MTSALRARILAGLLVTSLLAVGVAGAASAQSADGGSGSNVSVANTTLDYDGDRPTLAASAGERITGTTDLEPGSSVVVAVESADSQTPFLRQESTSVAENGSFAATFDLSSVTADTGVDVVVRNESTTFARVAGEVVRCTDDCRDPSEWPTLDRDVVRATAGGTAEIPITVPDTADRSVNVTIGDAEGVNFEVRTTVTDADEDGRVLVSLDTTTAGNGEPSTFLSVGSGDAIADVEQPTPALDDLDPAAYDLAVGPADAPYDIGTLVLTTDETPTESEADEGDPDPPDTTGEVTFVTAGDTLQLGNARDQAVHAETSLEAGETVRFRVRSADPSSPFLRTAEANVTDTGTVTAVVDLHTVSPNATFEVIARHDGETVGWTDGRVVAGVDRSVNDVGGTNRSDGTPSNVVVDGGNGSIPVEALGALGLGGVLSLLGVARFTGLFRR